MRILKPAAVYFALIFGAGFLLGALRVTLIVPRIGARAAELAETPLMLLICAAAATWVLRRFPFIRTARASLATGGLAVGILLAAEFAVGLWIMHFPPTGSSSSPTLCSPSPSTARSPSPRCCRSCCATAARSR